MRAQRRPQEEAEREIEETKGNALRFWSVLISKTWHIQLTGWVFLLLLAPVPRLRRAAWRLGVDMRPRVPASSFYWLLEGASRLLDAQRGGLCAAALAANQLSFIKAQQA